MSSGSENLKISLEEIKSISNNFDKQNIIGRGGYGPVYLGQSEKHGVVAIKRLERGHGQGDHEYGMEVTLLSKYKHENLVSLVGFCGEDGEKILVYKYEANQSLDRLLINGEVLPWRRRLEICLGAARGFSYLHNETGTEHGVIHRDIKSSNILLDENWNAKISDFGLSRVALTSSADSILFTAACGTLGYIDPEYIKYGTLTQKSDVYSFGVVLFEVLFRKLVTVMGRDANGPRFTAEMAKKHYEEHTLDKMIDVDLRNEMNSASLCKFSTIAYECLKNHREDRPTMKSVVKALEKALGYDQRKSSSENPLGYQQLTISKHIELSTSEFSHDVYISFRSAAARTKHFVGWICDALEGEGVSIYKGNTTMFTKESVHLSAIKHTRSFIIVFSKNFAANSWNLDELAEIIKCNKERRNVVLPVYANDVHPCHVRELKGIFGEAMSKYDSDSRVGVWKNALVEAANLPGLLCDRLDTDIAKKVAASMKGQLAKSQQYN